jgi:hypothetical protein
VTVEDYQQIVQFALDDKDIPATPDVIPSRVRYALQERGYFRAEVGDAETTIVSESPTGEVVDVAVRVNPGSIYKLQELILAGNRAFPAEQLRAQLPFSPGDLFTTEKVRVGLDNLRKLYADEGYINFIPVPRTTVFEDRRGIMLRITFQEGARFYFGDLNLTGLPLKPGTAQALEADWSLRKGESYSPTGLDAFLKNHSGFFPDGFDPERNLAIHQDVKSHTVTVEVLP